MTGEPIHITADEGFGVALKAAREYRNWSQETLAKKAGVNVCSISYYENGRHMPGGKALLRLFGALGVELWTFTKKPDGTL